ncbi:hypothetical protein EON65_48925 [archaeon]|nr:MAG: hypothetical protein EON65_48925 [archaeon]
MVRNGGEVTVTWSEEGVYEGIPINRLAGDFTLDWPVLERTDGKQFPEEDTSTTPICEVQPKVVEEPNVKAYYSNVSAFADLDPRHDLLSVEMVPRTVVLQYHLNMPQGVFSGSSGGAVVDRMGRAVGCDKAKEYY